MAGTTENRGEGEPAVPPPSTLFIYDAPKKRLMEFRTEKDTIYIWCEGQTFTIKLRQLGLTPDFKWEVLRGATALERKFFDSLEECVEAIGDFSEAKKQ